MTTHFITAEIELQESPVKLEQKITEELAKEGEPLRWAITAVDQEKETVKIEGVVTKK